MGVMACDRDGCPNIMCDKIILEGTRDGYLRICGDCWEELLFHGESFRLSATESWVEGQIRAFMRTEPRSYGPRGPRETTADIFKRLTGSD